MSWKEKTIASILLIIARMLTDDSELLAELKKLSISISVNAPKPDLITEDEA